MSDGLRDTDVGHRTTPPEQPDRDEAIERLEALFDRLSDAGMLSDAAVVSYALALLKQERGDYERV